MIYTKDEILKIWAEIFRFTKISDALSNLTDSDIRKFEGKTLVCPRCQQEKRYYMRLNNQWKCLECWRSVTGRFSSTNRTALAHRITNDMFEFFGEISSEKLFNPQLLADFLRFYGIEDNATMNLMFMKLIKNILARETGALGIINYLSKTENKLKRLHNRYTIHGTTDKLDKPEPTSKNTESI